MTSCSVPSCRPSSSTFGLSRTDPQTVYLNGEIVCASRKSQMSLFDDTQTWWHARDMHGSADHPGTYKQDWIGINTKTGTTIKVLKVNQDGVIAVPVHAAR